VKEFYCRYNHLTSLKHAPQKVVGFYCLFNKLTSLEGAPQEYKIFEFDEDNLNLYL
jgi:hypothetical protein